MANIVFASNNISHWPLSESSSQAGTFDATRVPYSIRLIRHQYMYSPIFAPVPGDTSWVHFRLWFDAVGFNDEPTMISAFDTNGNLLFDFIKPVNSSLTGGNLRMQTDAGSTTVASNLIFNIGLMNQVDFEYTAAVGSLELKMYINGALSATINHGTNGGALGSVAYFVLGAMYTEQAAQGDMFYSEILVTDVDTRNARINLLRATSSGGETDWIGNAVNLGDDDPTSGMTTTLINQRQTVNLSAYSGAQNISAVVVASQSYAGLNGPQNIRHTVRLSTVNYDSPADIPIADVLQYELTDFQINPATSLPWVGTDLATMEIGIISKT